MSDAHLYAAARALEQVLRARHPGLVFKVTVKPPAEADAKPKDKP